MDKEFPLNQIPEWPREFVERLQGLGITTAEQIVSRGSQAQGPALLAKFLNTSEHDVERLVELARRRLSPAVAEMMSAKVDTTNMGLGGLPIDKSGK